jgi:hypothetical protein
VIRARYGDVRLEVGHGQTALAITKRLSRGFTRTVRSARARPTSVPTGPE